MEKHISKVWSQPPVARLTRFRATAGQQLFKWPRPVGTSMALGLLEPYGTCISWLIFIDFD